MPLKSISNESAASGSFHATDPPLSGVQLQTFSWSRPVNESLPLPARVCMFLNCSSWPSTTKLPSYPSVSVQRPFSTSDYTLLPAPSPPFSLPINKSDQESRKFSVQQPTC